VSSERRTEIQWLRALAAIEVVICHSDLLTKHFSDYRILGSAWYQPLGGIGVELFFIVSGYVICMRAPEAPGGGRFLLSRILRLYPMYWIFTSLVLVAHSINPSWRLNNYDPGFISLAKSYLILPQWGFPILGVGWTLEHEMIFYAFVAVVIALWGLKGPARPGVAWALAGMGLVGSMLGPGPSPWIWTFHACTPYMFAFGLGWLLRWVEEAEHPGRYWHIALFAGVGGIAFWVGGEWADRLVFRIAIAGLVFWGFIACRRAFEADTWLNRAAWKFGDASFSIYLSHWFVLSATGKALGALHLPAATDGLVRVLGITLSAFVGLWFFTALEKPIDRMLRRKGAPAEFPWLRNLAMSWRSRAARDAG